MTTSVKKITINKQAAEVVLRQKMASSKRIFGEKVAGIRRTAREALKKA